MLDTTGYSDTQKEANSISLSWWLRNNARIYSVWEFLSLLSTFHVIDIDAYEAIKSS